MEIKRFGNIEGKTMMLLHGNLMCWQQFEDLIPLLERKFCVYAVSFDGFDGTGETTYTTARDQADKLAAYIEKELDGRLGLLFAESPADAAEKLRTYGRQIICTSPYAEKLFYDADMAHRTALVIGNEANGVCEELQNAADVNVKLPMEGTIESLNAAVAAAVVMYEAVRQRHMR